MLAFTFCFVDIENALYKNEVRCASGFSVLENLFRLFYEIQTG